MNCYNFELNISAYIEGELKQAVRAEFVRHKEECKNCGSKLADISSMIKQMPHLSQLTTSDNFMSNLRERIQEIDNRGPSIWERISQFTFFGFEPVPAMGFALAMVMVIGASYLLINQDQLPNVDLKSLSTQSTPSPAKPFTPSVTTPDPVLPAMADSDSAGNQDNVNRISPPIKLVGGK